MLKAGTLPTSGWSSWQHKIMPSIALGFGPMALFARLVRGTMLETLQQDYVRTARAKGLRYRRVVGLHVLRNSLIPVVTAAGPLLGFIITGSFVIELIFNIPGIGQYYVTAVSARDFSVVMGLTVLLSVIVIVANLVVDVLYGFPTTVFVIVVMAVLNTKSLVTLFALIGAISWLGIARQTRAQVLSLRHREFVEAARALGAPSARILFGHIVPNALGVIIVAATASLPTVMLTEAFLSFIGLGVQAPLASWGSLVLEGSSQIIVHPWLLIGPGVVMGLTIFSLNFLGDGLRDALDPRTRKD